MRNISVELCLKRTEINNQNSFTPREKKPRRLCQGKRNTKFGRDLKPCPNPLLGFTILEVMVALAIMGISISIFFSLVGNSSRLRGKIDEHAKVVLLARTKVEEAFLDTLKKNYINVNEARIFEGKTKDGIQWKVTENDKYKDFMQKTSQNIMGKGENNGASLPEGTRFLNVQVEEINIDTIFSSRESKGNKDAIENEKKKSVSETISD